ncbi:MAG TPA: hypothetical protein VL688_13055 [Verrucomicrobiae bacterium]|jgi:hypothetical protein|nr:hypothetical protein [Verrucomicrobiae bacterium]
MEGAPLKGVQPLDRVMTGLSLTNHDLVASSTEQLTHKNVANARKGRPLTVNIQMKILNALKARTQKDFSLPDLFNYKGRSQKERSQHEESDE